MSKGFNMKKKIDITVWNKLIKEKRDINMYHHSNKSAHIISCNSSLTRGIKPMEENDYLHISVGRGPGYLKHYCILNLPSFLDFRFSITGEAILIHSGERTLLQIPPGPPTWELKMTIPSRLSSGDTLNGNYITIGDDDELPDSLYGECERMR